MAKLTQESTDTAVMAATPSWLRKKMLTGEQSSKDVYSAAPAACKSNRAGDHNRGRPRAADVYTRSKSGKHRIYPEASTIYVWNIECMLRKKVPNKVLDRAIDNLHRLHVKTERIEELDEFAEIFRSRIDPKHFIFPQKKKGIKIDAPSFLYPLRGHYGGVSSLLVNDCFLFSSSYDQTVCVWKITERVEEAGADGGPASSRPASSGPDSSANGGRGDAGSGDEIPELPPAMIGRITGFSGAVHTLAFFNNGEDLLACTSNYDVEVGRLHLRHTSKLPRTAESKITPIITLLSPKQYCSVFRLQLFPLLICYPFFCVSPPTS